MCRSTASKPTVNDVHRDRVRLRVGRPAGVLAPVPGPHRGDQQGRGRARGPVGGGQHGDAADADADADAAAGRGVVQRLCEEEEEEYFFFLVIAQPMLRGGTPVAISGGRNFLAGSLFIPPATILLTPALALVVGQPITKFMVGILVGW